MTKLIVTAPEEYDSSKDDNLKIFLGGSIEEGRAEQWQKAFINSVDNDLPVTLFNPRREIWNDNEDLDIQVNWELDRQIEADICFYYFDPKTKSPVTMFELGLFKEKAVVCCPDGFWRKKNIDITCKRLFVKQVLVSKFIAGLPKIIEQRNNIFPVWYGKF